MKEYDIRNLNAVDLEQYNALLRYAFQITEKELTECGWQDDEIKQSKFPVIERADVLGCFDGDELVSQIAVYPLKMNIYGAVYPVGFVTSVCTYPEYSGRGIMKRIMHKSLEHMRQRGQSVALLFPYSIPLYRKMGWEIISNKNILHGKGQADTHNSARSRKRTQSELGKRGLPQSPRTVRGGYTWLSLPQ